jgi:hypothetical protein
MSKQIDESKIELVQKVDDIPRRDFKKILPSHNYSQVEIS